MPAKPLASLPAALASRKGAALLAPAILLLGATLAVGQSTPPPAQPAQAAAPAYLYRFDWETPEGGGHMRSPHTVEIPFVFNNIDIAGPLISKMPEAYALAEKVSASWAAFARTGNPNVPQLPAWPAYSAATRDTLLFNNEIRVEQDPDRGPRQAMEQVLNLS